jgi:hypothetical protein
MSDKGTWYDLTWSIYKAIILTSKWLLTTFQIIISVNWISNIILVY